MHCATDTSTAGAGNALGRLPSLREFYLAIQRGEWVGDAVSFLGAQPTLEVCDVVVLAHGWMAG